MKDVEVLEGILWSEVGTKQDYEAEYGQKPLGLFGRLSGWIWQRQRRPFPHI